LVWNLIHDTEEKSKHTACYAALRIVYQLSWGVLDEIIEDSSEKPETKAVAALATCSEN